MVHRHLSDRPTLQAYDTQRLERACVTDSTHWSDTDGDIADYFYRIVGEPIIGDQMHYHYGMYPDQDLLIEVVECATGWLKDSMVAGLRSVRSGALPRII